MNYSDENAEEMGRLQDVIDAEDLWSLDASIDIAMEALRCPPDDADVKTLSGGEKRRVALCKLLLEAPDMLLLDEPTNHLDAETIAWLQKHLMEYKGTILIVTHDRYFLDDITSWILELDRGRGIPYEGNYTATAAAAFLTRATTPHGWSKRPSVWRMKRNPTRRGRKRWNESWNGSGRAPRHVRPSRRRGSNPTSKWPTSPNAKKSAARRSSFRTARALATR
jgi:ATPase subunit of ABC transporter with duplicated ATPase domains